MRSYPNFKYSEPFLSRIFCEKRWCWIFNFIKLLKLWSWFLIYRTSAFVEKTSMLILLKALTESSESIGKCFMLQLWSGSPHISTVAANGLCSLLVESILLLNILLNIIYQSVIYLHEVLKKEPGPKTFIPLEVQHNRSNIWFIDPTNHLRASLTKKCRAKSLKQTTSAVAGLGSEKSDIISQKDTTS